MDTMLFRQNTCKTGNNAVEMSQAFHDIARFKRFTDLNLFNARELQVEVGCNYTPRQNLTPTGLPTCNQATSPPASVPQTPPSAPVKFLLPLLPFHECAMAKGVCIFSFLGFAWDFRCLLGIWTRACFYYLLVFSSHYCREEMVSKVHLDCREKMVQM